MQCALHVLHPRTHAPFANCCHVRTSACALTIKPLTRTCNPSKALPNKRTNGRKQVARAQHEEAADESRGKPVYDAGGKAEDEAADKAECKAEDEAKDGAGDKAECKVKDKAGDEARGKADN